MIRTLTLSTIAALAATASFAQTNTVDGAGITATQLDTAGVLVPGMTLTTLALTQINNPSNDNNNTNSTPSTPSTGP